MAETFNFRLRIEQCTKANEIPEFSVHVFIGTECCQSSLSSMLLPKTFNFFLQN